MEIPPALDISTVYQSHLVQKNVNKTTLETFLAYLLRLFGDKVDLQLAHAIGFVHVHGLAILLFNLSAGSYCILRGFARFQFWAAAITLFWNRYKLRRSPDVLVHRKQYRGNGLTPLDNLHIFLILPQSAVVVYTQYKNIPVLSSGHCYDLPDMSHALPSGCYSS